MNRRMMWICQIDLILNLAHPKMMIWKKRLRKDIANKLRELLRQSVRKEKTQPTLCHLYRLSHNLRQRDPLMTSGKHLHVSNTLIPFWSLETEKEVQKMQTKISSWQSQVERAMFSVTTVQPS